MITFHAKRQTLCLRRSMCGALGLLIALWSAGAAAQAPGEPGAGAPTEQPPATPPPPAAAADQAPSDPVDTPRRKPRRKGLIVGGAITFGAAWQVSVLGSLAYLGGRQWGTSVAYIIPVIGPMTASINANASGFGHVMAAIITFGQVAGLGILALGMSGTSEAAPPTAAKSSSAGGVTWGLAPMLGATNGLSVAGQW